MQSVATIKPKLPTGYDPANLTEKQVSEQLDAFMQAEGWRRIRHSSGTAQRVQDGLTVGMMQIGEPGMPDRQYVYYLSPGSAVCLVVWVELKRSKNGKRRDTQASWHAREKARGAVIYCGENDGRRFSIDHYREWYDGKIRPILNRVAKGQRGLFA